MKRRIRLAAVAPGALLVAAACAMFRGLRPVTPIEQADLDVRTSPHRAGLVESGWNALALRVHLLRTAERSIELQTFIWSEDEVGVLLAHELARAARRGVRVRVLSDGLHTRWDPEHLAWLSSADPNLELRQYNPRAERLSAALADLVLDGALHFGDFNQRAHDKLMVVDDRWTLVGGRNLENTYYDCAPGRNFRDREVLVDGEVASDARRSFERFWDYRLTVASSELLDVAAFLREPGREARAPPVAVEGLLAQVDATLAATWTLADLLAGPMHEVEAVAFCCDAPGKSAELTDSRNQVTRTLGGLVRAAERSVLTQTPYFVLSDRALSMLEDLRAEHPEIRLEASTNSLASTDIFPASAVSYRQKWQILERLGIHLYEFKPRPADLGHYLVRLQEPRSRTGKDPTLCLHSKSVVIDELVAGIGSHNLGPRSSELNTEVMLFVWDPSFARALSAEIARDIHPRNSWVVWKREQAPLIGEVQYLLEHLSRIIGELTTVDVWPSFYASSFELVEGGEPLPPGAPGFYEQYRPVGLFPGLSATDEELWLTRILKAVGGLADPLL